jgi:large subunit ribosomal protein L13
MTMDKPRQQMENLKVEKTYIPKGKEIEHEWFLVDAKGQNLGRLATKVATILLGKHKPIYTPGVDMGDFVVVVNCEQVEVTGNKLTEKFYYRHSIHPGGQTATSLRDQLKNHPDRVLRSAVWGMIPHNKFGRELIKNLKVYAGPDHPHSAQQPKSLIIGEE